MTLTIDNRKQMTRRILILMLIGTLMFNMAVPKKADAFFPAMVLGGMALGEALYTLAAIGVTGYGMYQIADHVWDDVRSAAPKVKAAWNALSSTAKASWATLEEATVNGTASVILTAQQWMDAMKAGILSITGASTTIPAFNWPGANYTWLLPSTGTLTAEWIAMYSIMTFTINGNTFYFVPQEIDKVGRATNNAIYARIGYKWVLGVEGGGAIINYTMPGSATTFNRDKLVVSVDNGVRSFDGSNYYIQQDGTLYNESWREAQGIGFVYPNWNDALRGFQDSVLAFKMYMQMVYGGTAISAPAVPGIPAINKEWDATKPVAIPVPPGAITYPQTGTKVGTLTLTAEQIKTMTAEMAKAANPAIPTNPTAPDWSTTPSEKLNFEPLKMTGVAFTKSFPFSIPWDLYNQLAIFNVAPKAPKVTWNDPKFIQLAGATIPVNVEFDLARFDSIALAIRWIGTIAFDVGVILAMRRLMPE